jgi:hypothetical protein
VIILSHGADNGRIVCSDGLMIDIEEDVYKWVIKKEKNLMSWHSLKFKMIFNNIYEPIFDNSMQDIDEVIGNISHKK